MAIATQGTASNYLQRAPSPSGLADVVDLILDKGLVIDAYVRIAVIGIELITIDARIVIASVDTYLRFAEAVNRLDLTQTEAAGLAELRGDNDSGGNGRGGASVEPVRFRELAALTSPVPPGKVRAKRADLLRHFDVLGTAFEHGTVVPLRFGIVFDDEAALVRDFLEP